jgi:N-acetylglucosaminyl-diphospho-decaprenol L-rhamnosyltransferase
MYTDTTKLTTLIVTYNSEEVISDLLDDLARMQESGKIIVIDNASLDQTAAIITTRFPDVQLVRNSRNLGYAKAINHAFDLINSTYVLLLNPDIRIPTARVIQQMVQYLDSSYKVGAVGPLQNKIGKYRTTLNFTCSYLGIRAFAGYIYTQLMHQWPSPNPIRVPLLNAGCIMIRRAAFIKIGKFNPKYFLYGEDPDLGMKLMSYGYECWLLPDISVIHYREKSLQTLPTNQIISIRIQAILNIIDAFLCGLRQLLINKIATTKRYHGKVLRHLNII